MVADETRIRPATIADWPAIQALLASNQLPTDGARDHLSNFLIAERDGQLIGCIGLERYGNAGLLRSCAVNGAQHGKGVGKALTEALIANARQRGLRQLVLLTTTAEDYFPRFGFTRIARDNVPDAIKVSAEFQGACPASAVVMARDL